MRRVAALGVLLLALALVTLACGDGDETVDPGPASDPGPVSGGGPSQAVGPGISVQEALDSDLDGPLLVNGFLITDSDGPLYLSEGLAESLPPQQAGAKLRVEGLDLDTIEGLKTSQGISWTDHVVQVLGTVDGDTLTVSGTSKA